MEKYVSKETGTVITPEMIDALAAEAEEGCDLDQGTVARVGRPPLHKGAGASLRISIRVTRPLLKAVHERAHAEGRRVSDIARKAIERYVKS